MEYQNKKPKQSIYGESVEVELHTIANENEDVKVVETKGKHCLACTKLECKD